MTTILTISGSLRAASLNTALLEALPALAPEGVTLERITYDEVPLFNSDLGEPPVVEALKERLGAADGVIIATPEYNYGVPGPLKNVLDWVSRPAYRGPLAGKPVGILGASMGVVGTARAQGQLKQNLLGLGAQVFAYPEVLVGRAQTVIDNQTITDERTAGFVASFLKEYTAFVARFA